MDFVHVHDIARANILAAQSDVSDEVFNVASGTETSLNELAEMLLTVMGSSLAAGACGRRARSIRCRAGWPTRSKAKEHPRLRGRGRRSTRGCATLVEWWQSERAAVQG